MLLDVGALEAGYGDVAVLRGVDIAVDAGELVAVLGANGAGKTTLLRAISGLGARVSGGSVLFDGVDLRRRRAEAIVRLGCMHVPEGRRLFTEMTVDDNLRLGAFTTDRRSLHADLDAIYGRFPALAARRHSTAFALSGGEQQMLAIGRALMAKPRLLMLDEPSTGLAPQVVAEIFVILTELTQAGTAVLLVEQNAFLTLAHAHRAYVLEHGAIALAGTAAQLRDDPNVQAVYLGGTPGAT
jgi:branched-chain amino acid transport system ATP-binding protein